MKYYIYIFLCTLYIKYLLDYIFKMLFRKKNKNLEITNKLILNEHK